MDVWHGSKGIIKKVNKVRNYLPINAQQVKYCLVL